MSTCAVPALKKQFPELLTTLAQGIGQDATVEVVEVFPSKGFEWQASSEWQSKLKKYLGAS